jgi:uncharacterized membrane protein YtjA (UPF0391 family)
MLVACFVPGMRLACLEVMDLENGPATNVKTPKEVYMFSWALMFLVIALIAALFGFTGIAGTATNIAWILFVVGIILAIVFAIAGRRPSI